MKKAISLLLILFIAALVVAQTPTTNNATIKNKIVGIKEKTDTIIENEIQIPKEVEFLARLVLGIKEPVQLSLLIVLIILWLGTFKILGETIKSIQLFQKGILPWIIALFCMLLIGYTGVLNVAAVFLLGFGNVFKIFNSWSMGSVILGIVLIGAIVFLISWILKKIHKKIQAANASITAANIGVELGFMSKLRKMFGFGRSIAP